MKNNYRNIVMCSEKHKLNRPTFLNYENYNIIFSKHHKQMKSKTKFNTKSKSNFSDL